MLKQDDLLYICPVFLGFLTEKELTVLVAISFDSFANEMEHKAAPAGKEKEISNKAGIVCLLLFLPTIKALFLLVH
jgi:hypothetical protein